MPEESKLVHLNYNHGVLSSSINETDKSVPPLANTTLLGIYDHLKKMSLAIGAQPCEMSEVVDEPGDGLLQFGELEDFTPNRAEEGEMEMRVVL